MIISQNSKFLNLTDSLRYHQQKKEISLIVQKLDKKRTIQIFLERSSGSLIQKLFEHQRKNQIKFQDQLQRQLAKHLREKRKTFSFTSNLPFKVEKNHLSQSIQILTKVVEKQRILTQLKRNAKLDPMPEEPHAQQQHHKIQSIAGFKLTNNTPKQIVYRPELKQLQSYLEQTDFKTLQRRKRIIEMLVLCLMRSFHGKLPEALEIALQASSFFQEVPKEIDQEADKEIILKCICFQLIEKIYKNILQNKNQKFNIQSLKSAKKLNATIKKRHSPFIVNSLTSERVFKNRFAYKLKKSKLLKEGTYLKELDQLNYPKNQYELRKNNQQQKKQQSINNQEESTFEKFNQKLPSNNQQKLNPLKVITQISEKLAVFLPAPEVVFPKQADLKNYNLIIHQRDIESTSKLFPYQYPCSIQKVMNKKDYIFLISSINSVIFSETQCYNFRDVLKKFITLIIALFIILLAVVTHLIYFDNCSIADWITQAVFFFTFVSISYCFVRENSENAGTTGERFENMVKQLNKWNKLYEKSQLIFKTTENCEAIIIVWPLKEKQYAELASELGQTDSINQQSLPIENQSMQSENLLKIRPFYCVQNPSKRITTKSNLSNLFSEIHDFSDSSKGQFFNNNQSKYYNRQCHCLNHQIEKQKIQEFSLNKYSQKHQRINLNNQKGL